MTPPSPRSREAPLQVGPVVVAGVLLGAGLGGFVDGIALHQLAQWHNMVSAKLTTDTLVNAKVNMFWDGVFHAGVWTLTAVGLALLFRAGGRADTAWSGRVLLGAMVLGWGVFNLVEGVINHQLLGLHHVTSSPSTCSRGTSRSSPSARCSQPVDGR